MNPSQNSQHRRPVPANPAMVSVDHHLPQVARPLVQAVPHAGPPVITIDDGDDEDVVQANAAEVASDYLRKRGYVMPEGSPKKLVSDPAIDDAEVDDEHRNTLMMLQRPELVAAQDTRRFEDSYCELRDWVDGSLDIYKAEFHALLYPLLVHCFMQMIKLKATAEARAFLSRCSAEFREGTASQRRELNSLSGIATPQHLEENEVSNLFLKNRYEVHLSQYAFELLMAFLSDDPRRVVLVRILNMRLAVRIDEGIEASRTGGLIVKAREDRAVESGFVPSKDRNALLRTDVLWGRLRPEHYLIPDEDDAAVKNQKNKQKPTGDKAKQSNDAKAKVDTPKKDVAEEEEEPAVREDGTLTKSRVPLKKYRLGAKGIETSLDRKNRAKLYDVVTTQSSCDELAILCYTFTNTHEDGLNCSASSEDGSLVVAGFGDSSLRIWDAKNVESGGGGHGTNRLIGHSGPVYTVDWTKCGRFVLSGSEDGSLRLWSADYRTDIFCYKGHNYPVWSAAFSPLDHYFVSGGHDRTARVWSTDCLVPLRIFAGHLADVDCVRWHPNCNYVATGSSDRTARLWDVREGKCVRVFGTHRGTVHTLAFSPDGRTLACGGDADTIDIWDIGSGKRMCRLSGHSSTVWSLDYSRQGAMLASGGADCKVCVWRATDWSSVIQPSEDDSGQNGSASNGEKANGEKANGKKNGESVDADGDVRMGGDGNGTGKGDDDEGKDKDTDEAEEERKEAAKKRAEQQRARGSPLLEAFETKDTPVHSVKFTRKNVLIAIGSFRA
ncbi:TFIID subunit TAF5 NTD2 [Gracilaria domingensis]|nr:TFIID subunit TAF5 NTD2 [Gracilaria domingensis]